MRSIPPPSEPLRDDRVTLRLAAERDIPEILIAYQDDPTLHVNLGEDRPPSGADLGRRMEQAAAAMDRGTSVRLTITDVGADDCRGEVIVYDFDWDNARADIGIWVAPQLRGNGVARRALRLATGWLFESCGLRRVALLTDPGNEPMQRAARAAGFQYEGVLRKYIRARGSRVDMAILSMVPGDLAT
jgi:RimJ/RimL family protein N-acetyltransferase